MSRAMSRIGQYVFELMEGQPDAWPAPPEPNYPDEHPAHTDTKPTEPYIETIPSDEIPF